MPSSATIHHLRVGDILVEAGHLSADDLSVALDEQRASGRRLGELLVAQGAVSQKQLLHALALQFGHEFVDLEEYTVDPEVVQQIEKSLARRHRALPIARKAGRVVVAMANPNDILALDDVRNVLGCQVHAVMADAEQISRIVDRLNVTDARVQEAIHLAVRAKSTGDEGSDSPGEADDDESGQSPVVAFVDVLLAKAVHERASDIHVEPGVDGVRVRFRVDGVLHVAVTIPSSLHAGVVNRIKVMAEIDIAEKRLPQDGRLSIVASGSKVDLRVVTLPTVHGEAIILRVLTNDFSGRGVKNLGFLPYQIGRYADAYRRPWGAVLVTGPTGSGKSTTLYGTLEELCDTTRNIITIEDPVEVRIPGVKQVQVNNKAGMTFPNALRSFLRADPDIILIGEIRDGETATMAIEASLTGHLVLSTLHTNNAAAAPMRLVEMGVQPFLVTSSLTAVVAQRLARQLCEACKVGVQISSDTAKAIGVPRALLGLGGTFLACRAVGCEVCAYSGYLGRFAIHEVLVMSEAISQLVLSGGTARDVERAAISQGMLTLQMDGLHKVAAGLTSLEELHRVLG